MSEQQVVAGKRRCIGFGDFEDVCTYTALPVGQELWCQRCAGLRIEIAEAAFSPRSTTSFAASTEGERHG